MKTTVLLLLAVTCIVAGCKTYPASDDQRRKLQAQLRAVVVDDDINEQEADIIAQSYFLRYGPGCGAAAKVSDDGTDWVASTVIGYAAIPTREPIRIHKHTGRVTWSDGPTIEDPKTIW